MKFSIKFLLGITAIAALMAAVATLSYRKASKTAENPLLVNGRWRTFNQARLLVARLAMAIG
jgi:hypothetical protein